MSATTTSKSTMSRTATRRGSSRRGAAPARSAAKDTLEHYKKFAATLRRRDDETGAVVPFALEDWEEEVAADYFAGYDEVIAEVPSGSGKTTFFATIALHHGTYVRFRCRVLVLSSSGKQARQMYEAIAGFIDESRDLKRWWVAQEYGLGRIKSLAGDRGLIEIVSPSPKVVEGEIPTLVLSDEIHRHADDGRAHSILASKLQKRGARILGCTTAGDDELSFLGRKRTDALHGAGHLVEGHLVPQLRTKGEKVKADLGREVVRPGEHYTVSRDVDGHTAWHEWSLPDDADENDFEQVKLCNPASFVTLGGLRMSHKLLRTRPWDWLRQHCNRWALGEQSAVDATAWKARGDRAVRPLETCDFWVGLDMGGVSDSTAVIPVWRVDPPAPAGDDDAPPPTFVTCRGRIVWPPNDGEWTLVDDVLEALDAVTSLPGRFQGLVFDRNRGGGYVAQELERKRSWTIIDHGQAAEMDDASELLATLVVEGRLSHDADEAVTRQVLAAAAKRSRRNRWYLAKPPSQLHRKIDAAVALAMALRVANAGLRGPQPLNLADYRIGVL